MNLQETQAAITKASKGINQYGKLMVQFNRVNVFTDTDFQREYNAFYRVQRRKADWYREYYGLMQSLKGKSPVFASALDRIHDVTGRYEPSFASKLVATIDPTKPVWDVHVLRNTGLTAPSYASKQKLTLAKDAYASIERWYAQFLASPEGQLCIAEFDRIVAAPQRFTCLKKIDFILWQHRTP